jgi:MFS family permease
MVPKSVVLRRFALSHFFLEFQFWFPVWLLFLTERGFELTTIVLADGVFRFTMVALEFPLGVFSDRVGRKKTYILVAALAVTTYGGIIMINGRPMLFAVWILWGVFWAMASGSTSAYSYELIVLTNNQSRATSIFGFLRSVASIAALLSYLAAGFLFSITPTLPFIFNGVLALFALLIALTLPETSDVATESRADSQIHRQFFARLRKNSAFFAGSLLAALALIYFWSPRILMQPLFIEMELAPELISIVYFSYALAGIFAGFSAGRVQRKLGIRPTIFAGLFLLWLGIFLIALVEDTAVLFLFPLLSFGYFLALTVLEVFLHRQIENKHRASVMSAISFIGGAFIIFTRPALGILADRNGAIFAFMVWAILGFGFLIAAGLLARKLQSTRTTSTV